VGHVHPVEVQEAGGLQVDAARPKRFDVLFPAETLGGGAPEGVWGQDEDSHHQHVRPGLNRWVISLADVKGDNSLIEESRAQYR
jgi:hypothetical protein